MLCEEAAINSWCKINVARVRYFRVGPHRANLQIAYAPKRSGGTHTIWVRTQIEAVRYFQNLQIAYAPKRSGGTHSIWVRTQIEAVLTR